MKRAISAVLLLFLLSAAALATDKYVAKDTGFSILPPGPVSISNSPDGVEYFTTAPDKSFVGAVAAFIATKEMTPEQVSVALDQSVGTLEKTGHVVLARQHVKVQGEQAVKFSFTITNENGEEFAGLGMFLYDSTTHRVFYVVAETPLKNANKKGVLDFMLSFELLR